MRTNSILKMLALGSVLFSASAVAQDYHFSQYDALVPTYQPAKTGMTNAYKYRAATQYRNQWRPLATKPFSTFALSYDMPINARWGAGGYIVNYDGAKVFNAFNVVLSGAYKVTDPAQQEHLLTAGLQMGMIYKNTNNSDLLFESQYSDGQFNGQLPSNETFQRLSKLMPEFNLGFYYEWTDEMNDYHPYAGMTVFHMSSPQESTLMNSVDSKLPRRFLFHTGCKYQINKEFKVDGKVMYQYQGKATELMLGATGSYLLEEQKTNLMLGCYYRNKDAVILLTGVEYEELTFTLGYDITTSSLNEFNGGKGALEFTLSYRPARGSDKSLF